MKHNIDKEKNLSMRYKNFYTLKEGKMILCYFNDFANRNETKKYRFH